MFPSSGESTEYSIAAWWPVRTKTSKLHSYIQKYSLSPNSQNKRYPFWCSSTTYWPESKLARTRGPMSPSGDMLRWKRCSTVEVRLSDECRVRISDMEGFIFVMAYWVSALLLLIVWRKRCLKYSGIVVSAHVSGWNRVAVLQRYLAFKGNFMYFILV